jgi:hypothetical protein
MNFLQSLGAGYASRVYGSKGSGVALTFRCKILGRMLVPQALNARVKNVGDPYK